MNPTLVTMQGPKSQGIQSLSNFEAGIATMGVIAREYPGITWGQLLALSGHGQMSGWFTDFKRGVGSLRDGIGDILRDTVSMVGGVAGSGIRLVTDQEVLSGLSQAAAAYATGGASAAAGSLGGGTDSAGVGGSIVDFLSALGLSSKAKSSGAVEDMPRWVLPVSVGIGGLLLVMMTRGGRR
jgi:hypothetical protein